MSVKHKAKAKRKKQKRRQGTESESKKREVRIESPEDRLLWKLVGVALFAVAAFMMVALASYDPPPPAVERPGWQCANLVGVVGNWFAYGAYLAFGFAAWCLPLAAVVGGVKLLMPIPKEVEEIPNVRILTRIAGLTLMALAVTGLFQLAGSATDSRTILDEGGAETLIGDGDMLYRANDGLTVRAQGAFVSRGEKNRIVEFAVKQWPSVMDEDLKEELEHAEDEEGEASAGDGDVGDDEYEKAKQVVIATNRASISHLQRQMRIGYNHAAKIIDLLEARGVIGPARGAGPREVIAAE